MSTTDQKELSNLNLEDSAGSSTSVSVVKESENPIENSLEANQTVSIDIKATGDHLPSPMTPSCDKLETKVSLNEDNDEQTSAAVSTSIAESVTDDGGNSCVEKSGSTELAQVLECNKNPMEENSNSIEISRDHAATFTSTPDVKPTSSKIMLNTETATITDINFKSISKPLLDSTTNSPSTPGDGDGYSSDMPEDEIVLKWDDDDEEVRSMSEEKDQDNITSTIIESSTKDILNEKDMLDKIDAQILELDSKKLISDNSNIIEKVKDVGQTEGTDFSTIKSVATNDSLDKSEPSEATEAFDDLKTHSQIEESDNEIDKDTTNATLDSIIANLDQIIDGDTAATQSISVNTVKSYEHSTSVPTIINLHQDGKTTGEGNTNTAENNTLNPILLNQSENKINMDSSNVIIEDNNTKTIQGADTVTQTDLSNDIDNNKMDLEASHVLDDEIDKSIDDMKITANSTEIEIDTSGIPKDENMLQSDDKYTGDKENELQSCLTEWDLSTSGDNVTIETKAHNLKKPNMMIEIPTQELITLNDNSLDYLKNDLSKEDTNNQEPQSVVESLEEHDLSKKDTDNQELQKVVESLEEHDKDTRKLNENVSEAQNQESVDKSDNIVTKNSKEFTDIDNIPEVADKSNYEELKPDLMDVEANLSKETQLNVNETQNIEMRYPKNENLASNTESVTSLEKNQGTENEKQTLNEDLSSKDKNQAYENEDVPSISGDKTVNQDLFSKVTTEGPEKEDVASIDKEPPLDNLVSKDQPSEIGQLSISGATFSSNEQSLLDENQPQMAADTSDEVPEVTDSLGLLAESSRVMEDDEEQETSEHDEGDDEEDFDPDDESSNQMMGENSEDSNAQTSESDMPKDKPTDTHADVQLDVNAQDIRELDAPDAEKAEFNIAITNVVSKTALADIDGVVEAGDDIAADVDVIADDVDVSYAIGEDNAETSRPLAAEDTTLPIKPAEAQVDNDATKGNDTAETTTESDGTVQLSQLQKLLVDNNAEEYFRNKETNKPEAKKDTSEKKDSPTKTKRLEISQPKNFVNIVDLEESSSEDATPTDVQEVGRSAKPGDVTAVDDDVTAVDDDVTAVDDDVTAVDDDVTAVDDDVTNVNIPSQIEIMSSGGNTSAIMAKEGENVISGVPKPPPLKPARLNTGEVTIKTASSAESTLVVTEAKATGETSKPKLSLEVFSLDSDDEDSAPGKAGGPPPAPAPPRAGSGRCINSACASAAGAPHRAADPAAVAYYDAGRKRRPVVCAPCAQAVADRAQTLVEGIKKMTPLLELDMGRLCEELVEISDSDSEGEPDDVGEVKDAIGPEAAKLFEDHLSDVINETWRKYELDARLQEAQGELMAELDRIEAEGKEINAMFDECQTATDKLRTDLYNTFEVKKQELPPIIIFDSPDNVFVCTESAKLVAEAETRAPKRRLSSPTGAAPKRAAIPLGYAPLEPPPPSQPTDTSQVTKADVAAPPSTDTSKIDDDKDISVVTLSAEAAPADLPPPGDMTRAPLRAGMHVYAMRNAFGSWLRAKVAECTPKGATSQSAQFTQCRVKFESKTHKNAYKLLPARCLAYSEPSDVRMTIGTRLIALFKDALNVSKRESFYSGVVAEVPNPVNNYRYLVFFDDGYAQYVHHVDTRLVCEFSPLVWEEVHPFSREFVREYLLAYPERPMVRLHTGQSIKTEWNGKWWVSRVIQVDASLVQVHFQEDDRTEWIYRGSTRLAPLYLELQAAERHRARPLPRNRVQAKVNMPYVEYTRSEEPPPAGEPQSATRAQAQSQEEIRRQRAVAKKSTGAAHAPPAPASHPHPHPHPPPAPAPLADNITSRVVYYTPKNAVRPYRLVPHTCSSKCKRNDVLALQDLRTYNPLAKPLLSGWERQLVRYKGHKQVMYRAPCGRRVRCMRELHRYLRAVHSDMGVDLFDFGPATHCLAEFVLNKCIIAKKDLSNGKENVPVPCVNYYDHSLPEFCSYNTERTPTEGVPLNLDPEFLCGCDCTDDCEDKSKCACWQMTLEGARTIGLDGAVGYAYKRLPEPLPSGIYECNSRCKCKSTCLNRVAQHPLQLKLQVFKTLNRGWGIRALNDVPKGSFLCVYAGNLLTDATANLDGLNEGDEYLAELDYIEVVEQMKEGFEEDIPDADKKLDKKDSAGVQDSEEEMTSSDDNDEASKTEMEDGDFEPGYIGLRLSQFNKRLRKREKAKQGKEGGETKEDNCITISDDEELREPSRFMAQAGMGANEFISKYSSVRTLFGKDEACYIMDAKVQGNIGRYLNHSCSPNVFVQNVFVDSHDPRFPWVAFFALWPIRAGTELTWNYNYDIGSVPGKVLYCYCGAPNCRGRLL